MDRSQVVTIAVTALITTLITLTANGFANWLFGTVKTQVAKETTKTAARKAFSKNNLRVIWSMAIFVGAIWMLRLELRMSSPLTRTEVAWISLSLINAILGGLYFAGHVLARIFIYKETKPHS